MGMVFLAYDVPSGRQLHGKSLVDLVDSRTFFVYNSRYTPDGSHLYGLLYTRDRQELAVHFFNLQRGIVEPAVAIPFQPLISPLPVQQAASHDGRLLYVLSSLTRELAIVDLEQRKLRSIVPLDMGILAHQLTDPVYFPDSPMQLSPDGRWLYAIGVTSDGIPARRSGVWVIDVATLSIAGHWFTESEPAELVLSGDGRSLYVREDRATSSNDRSSVYWTLNAETGFVQSQLPAVQARSSLATLASLYSDVFGLSPAIAGLPPADRPVSAPLAGMQVAVDSQKSTLGDRTAIEVRFVDPLSGVDVQPEGSSVRYQQPLAVQALFTMEDSEFDLILDLGPASFARYRGVVTLPVTGEWSITVIARWSSEALDDLSRVVPGSVTVTSLTATPGTIISGFSNYFQAR